MNLLDRNRNRAGLVLRHRQLDLLLLAGGDAHQRLVELRREPSGAELHRVVAARIVRHHEVEDDDVARLCRPVGGRKIRARGLQLVQSLVDQRVGDLGLSSRHLEPAPVRNLGLRLHGERRRELPRLVIRLRELVAVLGLLDGSDALSAAAVQNQPPM